MATQQLTIPMFPLNVVILPGETKTLHIFEERYKQLVSDCINNDANFGIPFFYHQEISEYGVEVKIINVVKKKNNGEMDIVIEGVRVFKLLEYSKVLRPKLYGAGMVEFEEFNRTKPSALLQDLIKDYIWVTQQNALPIDAFDEADVYSIARLIDLSSLEKYQIIKTTSVYMKEKYLISKIILFTHILKAEEKLKGLFIFN